MAKVLTKNLWLCVCFIFRPCT